MKKHIYAISLCLLIHLPYYPAAAGNSKPDSLSGVAIEYPEVYELVNIILALTEYGRTDKWDVQKDFPYYHEILEYFEPVKSHPLLDTVNFSRARWQEFLSFRTDAYAFVYDSQGKISRTTKFYSFYTLRAFDKHLSLVQDFSDKSNFRAFYAAHDTFYQRIKSDYAKYFMIAEMREFLSQEFFRKDPDEKYSVVLSTLVGGQNLHRWTARDKESDFVPVPRSIASGKKAIGKKEQAIGIHSLFTEMDHAYVNPVSNKSRRLIKKRFDEDTWAPKSGYTGYGTAVFNEYMTWAVYDLFTLKYFHEFANEINLYWHYQNDSRGFLYSHYFSQKLLELYRNKTSEQTIKDLYGALLDWCADQDSLTKPVIVNPVDTLTLKKRIAGFQVQFSEPMKITDKFDLILEVNSKVADTILVTKKQMKFSDDNKTLTFELEVSDIPNFSIVFSDWGTIHSMRSEKGILLKAFSTINVKTLGE